MAEGLQRPDLFITEGGRSLIKGAKQKDRAQALLELVTNTLIAKNSLLFPVDASPRLLELLLLLDQHWSYQLSLPSSQRGNAAGAWNYPLCLVSRTAEEMLVFARSLMEWMGGSVADDEGLGADGHGGGSGGGKGGWNRKRQREVKSPLAFRHLKFFPTPESLAEAFPADRPKLVLAVPISLSYGPSRRLFTSFAQDEGSVIVLIGRSTPSTLGQTLFERWNTAQLEIDRYGNGRVGAVRRLDGTLKVTLNSKVPLTGDELAAHLEEERLAKEREALHRAAEERSRRMLEADDLESDSDSDESEDEDAANALMSFDEKVGGDASTAMNGGMAGNAFLDSDDIRTTSFDIYVKGQQTRMTGFFRSGTAASGVPQARFRMFPFVERGGRGRKVDVFGETLDVGAWLRKGREIEEETESEEVREAKRRKKEEEEKKKEPPEPPSKFITEDLEVQLQCSIFFVDMEGLNDGRAIKTIIPSLNPRRMIVVKSTPEATSDLLTTCRASRSLTKEIFTPAVGEVVTIGEHTNSFSVGLSEAVLQGLNGGTGWSKFEDYEIAQVSGRIASTSDSNVPLLDVLASSSSHVAVSRPSVATSDVKVEEMEDVKPASPSKPHRSLSARVQRQPLTLPTSLFIGDLRLLTLKSTLASSGIPAEFVGEGVLVCGPGVPALLASSANGETPSAGNGGVVAVRKEADGRVSIEGNVGDEYYRIRDAVYESFAQVVVAA